MKIVLIGCVNGTVTREGVLESQYFADDICEWSLMVLPGDEAVAGVPVHAAEDVLGHLALKGGEGPRQPPDEEADVPLRRRPGVQGEVLDEAEHPQPGGGEDGLVH